MSRACSSSSQTNKEIEYKCSQCSLVFELSKTPEPFLWQHVIKDTCPNCYYTPDHVIDNLYISNYQCAKHLYSLQKREIGRIIICGNELKPHFPIEIEYLKFDLDDSEEQSIQPCFHEAYSFIESSSTNVLVHCYAGISRSSTIVISYLMKRYSMTYFNAQHFLQSKRSCIDPNDGFQRQLLEYDRFLASTRLLEMTGTTESMATNTPTYTNPSSVATSMLPKSSVITSSTYDKKVCENESDVDNEVFMDKKRNI